MYFKLSLKKWHYFSVFKATNLLLVYVKNLPIPEKIFCGFPWSGLNFTNILLEFFTPPDPKSAKNTVKLSVFFVLVGSACIKAAHKMLVKLTPCVRKKFANTWKNSLRISMIRNRKRADETEFRDRQVMWSKLKLLFTSHFSLKIATHLQGVSRIKIKESRW